MKLAREGGPVRYSARVQYDGTDFAGFQLQRGARTVQGELESALKRLSDGRRVRVDGAGRTDAGVHARDQVIAFSYPGRLDRAELEGALQALLPADVSIARLRRVATGFRPRYRASRREYRYVIWNGPRSPLRERYALGVREPLDIERMQLAARAFVGTHDFSAFGGADVQPVRTLSRVEITRQGQLITIEVVGNAFLRGMVRRMVAALLRVGRGQTTPEQVSEALRGRSAAFGGEAAPAKGLILWRVPMGPERQGNKTAQADTESQLEQD